MSPKKPRGTSPSRASASITLLWVSVIRISSAFSSLAEKCVAKKTDAGITKWGKWMPVRAAHIESADADDHQHNDEFHGDHRRIEGRAFLDSFDENGGEDQRDQDGGQIEIGS